MPGSTDVSGLNVQFGALDFGSEAASATMDMAQAELAREQALAPMSAPTPVQPQQQQQSSPFLKPGSVKWGAFLLLLLLFEPHVLHLFSVLFLFTVNT